MADLKRQRPDYSGESDATADDNNNKRRKPSYNEILSFLDEETEDPNHDFSSLLTSLQDELSSDLAAGNLPSSATAAAAATTTVDDYACCSSSSSSEVKDEEEDEKERVIRHLLEASDDELGIPTAAEGDRTGDDFFTAVDSVEGYANWNGLWEFEDANANYYTMLQSELFM